MTPNQALQRTGRELGPAFDALTGRSLSLRAFRPLDHTMPHLSHSFSGTLRTFAYFMASGTQYTLEGVDYLRLYGSEPSALEQVYAIFANVLELDESGQVLNAHYAQKRATDYLRAYCDPNFEIEPPYEEWELALHEPPPRQDLK